MSEYQGCPRVGGKFHALFHGGAAEQLATVELWDSLLLSVELLNAELEEDPNMSRGGSSIFMEEAVADGPVGPSGCEE
eukprot:scaffold2327_cov96-Cylindrotheca_fusiformis.AAC.3